MPQNRRNFLKTVALAPAFVPASAFGANDRVAYGMIGTGNRGRWLNEAFQKAGAQCVALCDVYEPYLELARKASPPDAKPYVDYKELLAQPGIDCVVIATPDHQHYPNLAAALASGKDVYLEKPLSLSLDQSAKMIEAVRATKQVVQIGMHRRSMPFVIEAKKVIDGGALGRISLAKAMWNWNFAVPLDNSPLAGRLDWDRFLGTAPRRPLEPKRFRWWRGFWDYSGGNMTDQGTHLMDVVQWMTNSGPPRSAVCQGMVHDAKEGEVPDVFSATFEYPDFLATWTLDYTTAYDFDWSITFLGEKASMVLDRHGYRIYKNGDRSGQPWSWSGKAELVAEEADRDSSLAHQQNFLDCVRSRKEPNCTVEIAAAAVAGPHMANIALRENRKVTGA
jgi:predicted dehydrogenase